VKGGASREDGRSLSPEQTGPGQVGQGALGGVSRADLPLYLACREQGWVFIEDKT
jgi:hypothetical protein